MLPKPEQACWFKQSFLFWQVFFGIWKGIHLYSLPSNKTHGNMRIWLKIIDPETESEQRVNFCLEPETSVYKWLFQIGWFQIITWNNHSFRTGCLGYQVSKHEDTLWFLVVVLYPRQMKRFETWKFSEFTQRFLSFWPFSLQKMLPLMVQKSQTTTWDVQNLVNNGINYRSLNW